ncbi:flagellar hook-associated protein FlgL [Halobacillus halophilus]|uniref:Flagellar hook-associated protein n=1 Tax=Halobacillus halophilus (strain ATCC 35676 / DSM 2266 / JCM 20832 / KCTC 3685 / LMG 17431 / NBRC 102448 / NCIMB 2269) TaxID=866895 RepID=I0JQK4_HALH3|nr:flagellar hook-associated protein FlgL [Halobacillus halophilus]ASF40435.1 flagellar hook-associated protein FlgL [Halobacillus halophilus]CCG46424.1 flagellar hook-associated protein [Halobacillus halophilus DSM 2266]
MRVTQSMLSNNMLRNLSQSYGQMGKYQEQLTTGKKITKPSDDPVVSMKGINYRSQLTEVQQYKRNIGEVHNWMDSSDSSLDKATQAMQRVRELAVQASNGTYDTEQKANIAKEIRQLKGHMADIANTKVNDKYIFNGANTTEEPVDAEIFTINSSMSKVEIGVSEGVRIQANVNPQPVFDQGLFNDLEAFAADLETGSNNLDDYIAVFDSKINQIVNKRADLGARMNRVDLIEDRLESQEITASKMMSDNEDADIEKVITNLKTQESIHRAALGVGSRIIQPTLMDFLR